MLMYGTTMFLVNTVREPVTSPSLWGTVGALPGTRNLAGGMATSGAITGWLRDLFGGARLRATCSARGRASGPGAHGLLMLPYFAGERTPIMDPDARGVDRRADAVARPAATSTGPRSRRRRFGVRHNIEAMRDAGGDVSTASSRSAAAPRARCGPQIVSRRHRAAAGRPCRRRSAPATAPRSSPPRPSMPRLDRRLEPGARDGRARTSDRARYDDLYGLYRDLYPATRDIAHALAAHQRRARDVEADAHLRMSGQGAP